MVTHKHDMTWPGHWTPKAHNFFLIPLYHNIISRFIHTSSKEIRVVGMFSPLSPFCSHTNPVRWRDSYSHKIKGIIVTFIKKKSTIEFCLNTVYCNKGENEMNNNGQKICAVNISPPAMEEHQFICFPAIVPLCIVLRDIVLLHLEVQC